VSAILLDALGTIVRFEDPVPRLRERLASRHGVEVSADEAATAVRAEIEAYGRLHFAAGDAASLRELRRTVAGVLRDALPPAAHRIPVDELVPTLVDAFSFVPYPEVPAVLEALRARGHALAVVSNWDVSLHEVLDRTGLRPAFDVVVASAELGAAKPDPAIFAHALGRLGERADDALHAGDQPAEDVAGARAAGVAPVLVDRDGDRGEPPPGVPVVRTLDGLLDLAA
jgi:putative hydrolase of the HAD superfamily